MAGKHTPGPWYATPQGSRGFEIGEVEIGMVIADGPGDPEAEANARLIAAAPDLFEAAKALEKCRRDKGWIGPALDQIAAAIAKAEGKT